jgi:hypothetical protein
MVFWTILQTLLNHEVAEITKYYFSAFYSTDLTKLKTIFMQNNRITAFHPNMFSHLSSLNSLHLSGNTCIDKTFSPVPAKTTLENELAFCEVGYLMQIQFRIDAIEKKNDEKFQVLRKTIESNQETFEQNVNGTLAALESLESRINREIETIDEKLAAYNDKMEKRLGVDIETNAKEIHEVKKMVEEIKSDIYHMSRA